MNDNTLSADATTDHPVTGDVGTIDVVADLTDATFADATRGRFTAVDYWAPWCGPCRFFMPTFERLAAEHVASGSGISFGRVHVDDNQATADAAALELIPTVILYGPDGLEVGRTTGVPDADSLGALLAAANAAD
jgi:thioredoxin 1